MPGCSTYLPQVLESLHDTIKDALPQNIHLKEPTTAIRKLSAALEAISKSRDWVTPAVDTRDEQKWAFTERLQEEIEPQVFATGSFSPRYVNGPRLLTEHLLTEDDEQWAKLTLEDLVEHMPDNFKKVSLTHASVAELYVVSLYRAPLHITGYILTATHAIAFPGSSSSEELRQAKIDMGIYVMEEGVPRYTVQGARLYHLNVCPVTVSHHGMVECACQDYMVGE